MRPNPINILPRSFNLPSAMRFSSPVSAFSIFSARNLDLLDLYFRTDLFEIILEQFLFELLELAACRAHQILSAALADGHQVLLAHHAAVENPYATCFPMLTLDGAQDRFDRCDIGTVPIEKLVAEGKPVLINDQCQHQLLAVRTMVA